MIVWIKLFICAAIIFFAGRHVAIYADIIAEKTKLGGLWIGIILVSVATSLPELFTGIGSVTLANAPNLTIGNLIGANSYNLLNIALIDILGKSSTPLLSSLSSGQLMTAVFTLVPIMLVTVSIMLSRSGYALFSIANIGIFSFLIIISYCILTKIIYNFEKGRSSKEEDIPQNKKYKDTSLNKTYFNFALSAFAIIVSGIWLAYIGKELSSVLNLGESFTGNLFIGFITTLPEITVSIAAIMIGAKEIAIANMLGSNLFNMVIVFFDDVLYRKAPILEVVSPGNIISGCTVMAMTAVIILAMVTKVKRRSLGVSWYVPVLFVIFILGAYANYIGFLR